MKLKISIPHVVSIPNRAQIILGIYLSLLVTLAFFFPSLNFLPYIATAIFGGVYFLIILLGLFLNKQQFQIQLHGTDLIPLFVLFTWTYGLFLGVISGNQISSVLHNFAGLSLYLFYFILLLRKENINTILSQLCFLVIAQFVISTVWVLTAQTWIRLDILATEGSSAFRVFWSSSSSLFIVAGSISLLSTLNFQAKTIIVTATKAPFNKIITNPLTFVISSLFILGTGSKGFWLSYALVSTYICILCFWWSFKRGQLNLFVVGIVFLVSLATIVYFDIITATLGSILKMETGGDSIRNIQAAAINAELSFWGKGLGARLESGYFRDEAGYGFELTYHNIVHKLGIFSIIPFSAILYPVIYSAYQLLREKKIVINIMILSLMTFLIPSYGNPILYAPINVLIACYALILIRFQKMI